LPFISKILKNLKQKKLIEISKDGRYKNIKLSKFGLSIMGFPKFKNELLIQLKLTIKNLEDDKIAPYQNAVIQKDYNKMNADGFQDFQQWQKFRKSSFLNR